MRVHQLRAAPGMQQMDGTSLFMPAHAPGQHSKGASIQTVVVRRRSSMGMPRWAA